MYLRQLYDVLIFIINLSFIVFRWLKSSQVDAMGVRGRIVHTGVVDGRMLNLECWSR